MKKKTIQYESTKTEDFATIKVQGKKLPSDFVFIHKSILFRFLAWCFYYIIAMPLLFVYEKIIHRTKVIGKKKIKKELKHTGYFIYSNHTGIYDGYTPQVFTLFPKKGYVVSLQDTLMVNKPLQYLLMAGGAIPIPTDLKACRNFLKCLNYRLNQKSAVIIYPEATIWPYYSGQRPAKKGAFKYPRTFNVPVVFSCTTFRKPTGLFKKHRPPKLVIYLSDPVYPTRSDSEKDDEKRLEELFNQFIEAHVNIKENYSVYNYEEKPIDKPYLDEEVLTEAIDNYLKSK